MQTVGVLLGDVLKQRASLPSSLIDLNPDIHSLCLVVHLLPCFVREATLVILTAREGDSLAVLTIQQEVAERGLTVSLVLVPFMSELRQRKLAPSQPAESKVVKTVTVTDASDDEETNADSKKYTAKDRRTGRSPLLSPAKSTSGPVVHPARPPSPVRSLLGTLIPILLIVGIAVTTLSNLSLTKQERYAICSREGQVYITSEKSTECVVVHKDVIEFYGTIEETRTKFGDVDTLGSLAVWPGKASNNAGLKIYYTRPSWGVYPGASIPYTERLPS